MKKILTILMSALVLLAFAQEPGTVPDGSKDLESGRATGLTELYTVIGNYTLSADGAGAFPLSQYPVNVQKPNAGATVHKALLLGVPTWNFIPQIPNGCVTLAGVGITWDGTALNTAGTLNSYADVTSIVAPIIDAAAPGISAITVTECQTANIDGVALLVIFADPMASEKTIIIMFGGLSSTGDSFSITLSQPIDPDAPGALLNMGLGIEFGFQTPGNGQFSTIDVNGSRLTSAAGGADDAFDSPTNGNLITVGGIGDSNDNPVDPFANHVDHYSDDELYSLLPFITNTTVNILVETLNPSNDDNIFLAYFELSGAAILGEGILISQDQNTNCINTMHTVVAQVQDNAGAPVVGTMVDFEVISGPNAGAMASVATNASGNATFTYFGSGGPGFDQIQACFVDSQTNTKCSNVLTKEWVVCEEIPVSNWALYLGILLMITFIVIRFRRMI
jgi:hypothetical protein